MTQDLPTWIDSYYADEREEASALQRLIARYEPQAEPAKTEFREALLAVLEEHRMIRP